MPAHIIPGGADGSRAVCQARQVFLAIMGKFSVSLEVAWEFGQAGKLLFTVRYIIFISSRELSTWYFLNNIFHTVDSVGAIVRGESWTFPPIGRVWSRILSSWDQESHQTTSGLSFFSDLTLVRDSNEYLKSLANRMATVHAVQYYWVGILSRMPEKTQNC